MARRNPIATLFSTAFVMATVVGYWYGGVDGVMVGVIAVLYISILLLGTKNERPHIPKE